MIKVCKFFLMTLWVSCLFSSCTKTAPQLPANKGNVVDKNISNLMEVNQKLAAKEDSILMIFATKADVKFKKSEIGFWYKVDVPTNGEPIKDKDFCNLSCTSLSLDMKVIQTEKMQIVIGKKQLVVGLEEGLKLLHKGESATFIIPWYLAYGRNGKGSHIKPYTSIVYQIKLF